jgi:hypothetical protein
MSRPVLVPEYYPFENISLKTQLVSPKSILQAIPAFFPVWSESTHKFQSDAWCSQSKRNP